MPKNCIVAIQSSDMGGNACKIIIRTSDERERSFIATSEFLRLASEAFSDLVGALENGSKKNSAT